MNFKVGKKYRITHESALHCKTSLSVGDEFTVSKVDKAGMARSKDVTFAGSEGEWYVAERSDLENGSVVEVGGGSMSLFKKKVHWYCLSYVGESLSREKRTAYASVYYGLKEQKITRAVIEEGKVDAGVSSDSVLTSVSYLGRMSKKEFLRKENPSILM